MRHYFVIFFSFLWIFAYFSTSDILVILYFYSFRKIIILSPWFTVLYRNLKENERLLEFQLFLPFGKSNVILKFQEL